MINSGAAGMQALINQAGHSTYTLLLIQVEKGIYCRFFKTLILYNLVINTDTNIKEVDTTLATVITVTEFINENTQTPRITK
nr:hypothetical protein [Methylomarinum sp. Ch1-1]MDP4523406.1 hypothetical protein [Methylomarinum sp. Ch1-1]